MDERSQLGSKRAAAPSNSSLVLDNLVLKKFVIFTNNIYQSRKEAKLFPTCSQQVQFSFSSHVCMASSKRADKEIGP